MAELLQKNKKSFAKVLTKTTICSILTIVAADKS